MSARDLPEFGAAGGPSGVSQIDRLEALPELYVYYCVECERQTDRSWHIAKRGHPLIPQNDEEHSSEMVRIPLPALLHVFRAAERMLDAYGEASGSEGDGFLAPIEPFQARALDEKVDEAVGELAAAVAALTEETP